MSDVRYYVPDADHEKNNSLAMETLATIDPLTETISDSVVVA